MNEELRDWLATVEIEICGSDECRKDWVLWKDNADAVLAEIESAGYVVVERERWERVRRFAVAANAVQQHKNDVLGRDTISLPEVERLNLRLEPLYDEMEAAWSALQPGDLDGEADE